MGARRLRRRPRQRRRRRRPVAQYKLAADGASEKSAKDADAVDAWLRTPAGVDPAPQLALVNAYRALARTYVVEYFVADNGALLDPTWRQALRATPLGEAAARLLTPPESAHAMAVPCTMPWPHSLEAYARQCHALALDRHLQPTQPVPGGAPWTDLDPVLRVGLTPKKAHEIERLAPVIAQLAHRTGATHVVDVGSGVGHLVRILAYTTGLAMLGIEGSEAYVTGARERDAKCATLLAHRARLGDARAAALLQRQGPVRYAHRRVPNSLDAAGFADLVRTGLGLGAATALPPLVLVGLHTSGDLGPTLLRSFAEVSAVRAVVSVGCCYMHLSEAPVPGADPTPPPSPPPTPSASAASATPMAAPALGYPLSGLFAAHMPDSQLGWKLREMACHSVDAYRVRGSTRAWEAAGCALTRR